MTEYELSDRMLFLSGNIIILLNEAQASHIAIYLSVVFAFIAAAYVAGTLERGWKWCTPVYVERQAPRGGMTKLELRSIEDLAPGRR